MHNFFNALDKKILKNVCEIGQLADRSHAPAYVVGGFVRDIFLKRKNFDIDIVVEGDAVGLAKSYAARHNGRVVVHERFKTATVEFKAGRHVDFTTARRESYPHPGALPVVAAGNIADDLLRRDFTINAMAVCINRDSWGKLVDYYGGWADLRAKKVRVLHGKSFEDDPTRILRAVRFAQRFRFSLDKETQQLLKIALREDFPAQVKPERYFAEFKKILEEKQPRAGLGQLAQAGGLKFLSGNLRISPQQLVRIERRLEPLRKKGLLRDKERWLIYLMSLLERLAAPTLEQLLAKFNLRKTDRVKILSIRDLERSIKTLKKDSPPSQVYRVLHVFPRETILFVRLKVINKIIQKHIADFLEKYHDVTLDINGDDLKKLGVPEGKEIQRILQAVLAKKLDGRIRSRQDQLREVKRLSAQ
ncbi:MAG: hypothetical protein A2787_07100 [Omnitrophica WOR_2 bacterium RIFCSPHIGHO2_01_FULL_48_9]|nr:MAG: hypothetical protein A3D10_00390 [Omnitrophica WOR_2 bacterium RIFCSPHIGHO2_02_FULL_48_11]OGX30817.1 MAG: hypothetical protein A2787_07100 [Omnitrophica WOR_2 bacterium RIFCSPHIGHO2_01_FULL_48_9]